MALEAQVRSPLELAVLVEALSPLEVAAAEVVSPLEGGLYVALAD